MAILKLVSFTIVGFDKAPRPKSSQMLRRIQMTSTTLALGQVEDEHSRREERMQDLANEIDDE